MKAKLSNEERRKSYYMKIWGLSENNSHTDQRRFIKRPAPEPYHVPKFVKLNNWNWEKNFKSLEEATEFLLNYCRELGPLADECLQRLNKNAETIRKLTLINKQLRKGITNEANQHRKPF